MWLFIQPNDALFLRDGRSFDAGGNLYAGNLFPPYPTTCYGMLRTLLVHQVSPQVDYKDFFNTVPDNYKELLGNKKEMGTLAVKGPFFGNKDNENIQLYVPCPADIFYKKEDDDDENTQRKWYLLQPDSKACLSDFSDMETPFLKLRFYDEDKGSDFEPENHMIGEHMLMQYLMGQTDRSFLADYTKEEPFWQEESSTIIEREDSTLTAKEHQLAFPAYTRMGENKGLLLYIDDSLAPRFKGVLINRFGGEGRVCHVENRTVNNFPDQNQIIERIGTSGRFKVLLTSPGYFKDNAYYPDFLKGNQGSLPEGEWEINGIRKRVRLMTMAVKRADRIGGWDLAKGVPKAMIKAVPAGSVFYFEIADYERSKDMDWVKELVISGLPGTLPGGDTDYCKQGFNTFLTGGWDYV
ncbi:MAG: type III-B CRISPR module-associated Cmr3 family protein [Desulfococcaceae bacterium]|jgi:CRISPR-associated protein Cmr3|nr:type III-B CRISPR module-associated Cmr3 family protein [Desulfococcaceae bacterium]